MGWEYGIRTTEPAILPEVVKRLSKFIKIYRSV